jgi:hypothetical protein
LELKAANIEDDGHRVLGQLLIAGAPPDGSGVYHVSGRLFITRLDDKGAPPTVPPKDADADHHWWYFTHGTGDVLHPDSENYDVRYSWANQAVKKIDVKRAHYTDPYYTANPNEGKFIVSRYNIHWFPDTVFRYSFTEDSDGNGRIDRIRAQSDELSQEGDPFSKFNVVFEDGYEVDSGKEKYGYAFVPGHSSDIYIYLKEKDYPDTGAHPRWSVASNDSLQTGSALIQSPVDTDPIDTAPPRISYTLAVPGDTRVYIRMSEPVLLDGAAIAKMTNKPFAGSAITGVVPIAPDNDSYTDEFYVTLEKPVSATVLTDGTAFPVLAFDGLVDRNTRPDKLPQRGDSSTNPKFPIAYPRSFESLSFTYAEIDNSDISKLNPPDFLSLGLGLKTEIPNRFNADPAGDYGSNNRDQRASDILIMVEPNPSEGLSDPHFSIWPLRMRDTAAAVIDTENDVIGHIERYDGRGRLRPPQIETEFIVASGLNKSNIEKKLALYLSSLRKFNGSIFNAAPGDRINLPLVLNNLKNDPGIWFPDSGNHPQGEPGKWLPKNYKDLRWFFMPSKETYGDLSNRDYADHSPEPIAKTIKLSNSEQRSPMKEIVYVLPAKDNGEPLYGVLLDTWTAGATTYTFPKDWWTRERGTHKYLKPFNLIVFELSQQVSGVTILNNVIDPTKKERAVLNYVLTKRGRVTINVFTLDGTLVKRLVSEVKEPGEYNVNWEGTNQGGRPVARGMYFIRVVAPDIDEIRKVMVVK